MAAKKKSVAIKSMADEPKFTLLARDPEFYPIVMAWADRREHDVLCGNRPEADLKQVQEARKLAVAAANWRRITNGLWRK